eukprot:CAMPEP_0196229450 /NCGR_PEP_ID=MMETSP0913-20130531/1024_1 /TAXON_ID=49265 /ORGANISM="Thalassiosira rotula, Strain GSO102" /LENGTH=53 /DNA_ID=CAMNT_0041509301 /DNA_START=423 /DNA_END=584 /DNA_ORIENTATION=-
MALFMALVEGLPESESHQFRSQGYTYWLALGERTRGRLVCFEDSEAIADREYQ